MLFLDSHSLQLHLELSQEIEQLERRKRPSKGHKRSQQGNRTTSKHRQIEKYARNYGISESDETILLFSIKALNPKNVKLLKLTEHFILLLNKLYF